MPPRKCFWYTVPPPPPSPPAPPPSPPRPALDDGSSQGMASLTANETISKLSLKEKALFVVLGCGDRCGTPDGSPVEVT